MPLNENQKKAIRRLTATFSDAEKDRIAGDDSAALALIEQWKTHYQTQLNTKIIQARIDLGKLITEKEIWENV